MDTLAIIKRIELRLAELGMSKAEFYEKSGISSASYSQWNTGKYNPSRAKLQQAAAVLGLDLDYLCFGLTKAEKTPLVNGDQELTDYLEMLKNRPECRMLFQLTKNATKEDVEAAVRIIEALRNK